MNLNSLIPGIESFMEDVEITNNVTTGGDEETAAPAEAPAEAPAADEQAEPEEAGEDAGEEAAEGGEEAKPAEMKSSYFNW